jgi:hypothetical protein
MHSATSTQRTPVKMARSGSGWTTKNGIKEDPIDTFIGGSHVGG